MTWLSDLAARFLTQEDDVDEANRNLATIAGGGAPAAQAFLETCRLLGEAGADNADLLTAIDEGRSGVVEAVGALIIACFAMVRADYAARQDAQAARAALSARVEGVIGAAGDAYGADMHAWLVRLAGEAAVQISAIAATRAPLVHVETGISLPSSRLAFDLYGDPARGEDLVARNRCGTPMVMPVRIEAVAP